MQRKAWQQQGQSAGIPQYKTHSPACMSSCKLLSGDSLPWGLHSRSWHTLPHLESTMSAAELCLPLQQAALQLLHSSLQAQQLS